MSNKAKIIARYPKAYAARDVDGFWWVWSPDIRGALNDARQPTRSAAVAWKSAAQLPSPYLRLREWINNERY